MPSKGVWTNLREGARGRLWCSTKPKKVFTVRVLRQWNRLPLEKLRIPSLESVQDQVGWDSEQPGLVGGAGWSLVPSHPKHVMFFNMYGVWQQGMCVSFWTAATEKDLTLTAAGGGKLCYLSVVQYLMLLSFVTISWQDWFLFSSDQLWALIFFKC